MAETIHSFQEGPYQILNYEVKNRDDKVVIELNDGELGRLPIEDTKTVEQLREALDKAEMQLKKKERRQEEL